MDQEQRICESLTKFLNWSFIYPERLGDMLRLHADMAGVNPETLITYALHAEVKIPEDMKGNENE